MSGIHAASHVGANLVRETLGRAGENNSRSRRMLAQTGFICPDSSGVRVQRAPVAPLNRADVVAATDIKW